MSDNLLWSVILNNWEKMCWGGGMCRGRGERGREYMVGVAEFLCLKRIGRA